MTDIDVALRVSGDAADGERAMRDMALAARDMSEDVERAARDAARGMDGFMDGLDQTASTASQAAGGLGDLAGGLELVGAGGAAEQLEKAAVAIQAVAGVADLATVATNLLSAAKLKDTALTVKNTAATVANKAAQLAASAATKATAASQWLLNAALVANPLGLIILAVVALVAGFVLLYKKSDTFRALVQKVGQAGQKALGWIVDKAGDLAAWVKDKLPGAFDKFKRLAAAAIRYIPIVFLIRKGIELYGWVRERLPGAWERFKQVAVKAFNAIPIVFLIRKGIELYGWVRERLPDAWTRFKERAVSALDKITAPIRDLIDFVQDLIDKISNIDWPDPPGWLSDLGGVFGKITTSVGKVNPTEIVGRGAAPVVVSMPITVNGAVDKVGTAKQLQDIVGAQLRRIGVVTS